MTADEKQQKVRAVAVKDMVEHQGWKYLEDDMIEATNLLMGKLINEPDIAKIQELQLEIRGIQKLFGKVKAYVEIAS